MNPYSKYLLLHYEKLSEGEIMTVLNEVFGINMKDYDEESHYRIVDSITMASLKLKYVTVCDRLRKIYPLSFPDIERHYPNPVPIPNDEDMSCLAPPIPIYDMTDEQRKAVDDINKLTKSFRNK